MKQTLAFIGAGVAAVIVKVGLQIVVMSSSPGATASSDPLGVRLAVALVFFGVLIALDRSVFQSDDRGRMDTRPEAASFTSQATPQQTSAAMARTFSGVTDEVTRRGAIGEWLQGVLRCTMLIPFIFYVRFGTVGPLGWGLTVFFDVYCLLWAIGLFFLPRTEYHSPVPRRGDWLDRIGAFWLVGCAFGPFFGWIVTEILPITPSSWQWVYGLRVLLAAGVPIALCLPLFRYVRGRATLVALPLLLIVTLLPVSTALQVGQDLWEGPRVRQVGTSGGSELYLEHTDRSLTRVP